LSQSDFLDLQSHWDSLTLTHNYLCTPSHIVAITFITISIKMFSLKSTAVIGFVLAQQVFAGIFVTEPTSASNCSATLPCEVQWKDDGNAPSLATIGNCSIQVCSGSDQVQYCLYTVADSWDVTNTSITYENDPHFGPTGQFYFLKFMALNYPNPANPTQPYEAFSARFTLVGMMGAYNASIEGLSTAVDVVPTTTGTSASLTKATTSAAASTPATTAGASHSSGSPSPSASGSANKSGAVALTIPSAFASLVGVSVVVGFAGIGLGMLALGL